MADNDSKVLKPIDLEGQARPNDDHRPPQFFGRLLNHPAKIKTNSGSVIDCTIRGFNSYEVLAEIGKGEHILLFKHSVLFISSDALKPKKLEGKDGGAAGLIADIKPTTSRRITAYQKGAERQFWEPVYPTYPQAHPLAGRTIFGALPIDWICYCTPEGTQLHGATHCPNCGKGARDSRQQLTTTNRATKGRAGTDWRKFGKNGGRQ